MFIKLATLIPALFYISLSDITGNKPQGFSLKQKQKQSKTCNFVVVVVVLTSFIFSFAFARVIDKNLNTPIFSPKTDDAIPQNGKRCLRFLVFYM